jgi:transcriptional regulator with XRE-family HTH domain
MRDYVASEVKAGQRVRARLKRLLTEKQMTNRAFGKRLGHGDQWVSNLLAGRFDLSLNDLDDAARAVEALPSDLVRRDDEEAWTLTPSEMRLVRAVRALPMALRDHLRVLAEYLMGVAPEEIELLTEFRKLGQEDQDRVRQSVAFLRLPQGGAPRIAATPEKTQGGHGKAPLVRGRGHGERKTGGSNG